MNSILIKSAKNFSLKENLVSQWADAALKKYNLNGYELSIVFVEPEKIRYLNQHYRNLDQATSVLTFFQGQATPEKTKWLGDIVICPQQAKEKNLSIKFLIDHGICNLLSEISTAKSC